LSNFSKRSFFAKSSKFSSSYNSKESPPTTQPNNQQPQQQQQPQIQQQTQPSQVNIQQQDPLSQTQQSTTDNSNFVSNDGRGGYRGRGGRGAISSKPRGSSFSSRGAYRGNRGSSSAFVSRYPNPQYYVPQQPIYTPYNPYPVSYGYDELVYYLKNKLSFYFSIQNLLKDQYLRSQMDPEGWVPVQVIASFPGVLQLTTDINLVLDVMRVCEEVELHESDSKLRAKFDPLRQPNAQTTPPPSSPTNSTEIHLEKQI